MFTFALNKEHMFTGIIEGLGEVTAIQKEGSNIHYTIKSQFTHELKIDQSVAHDGVCLTVVDCQNQKYTVTAIDETLKRTRLRNWQVGTLVNLERCMKLNDRLDGHIVQGHVDTVGVCEEVNEIDGSWEFKFSYLDDQVTVPKGSITVNGVSLTVVESNANFFSVCIIPYTFEHTNFKFLQKGDLVNLEFDIIGKYVARLLQERGKGV
jgi:riboflavin synthase